MTTTDTTVSCDNCDEDVPEDATRCPSCGVMIVTLGRAVAVIVIGVLLIPVGLWAVLQIREESLSIAVLVVHLALIAIPILLMYSGSTLYRHRHRKLADDESSSD